MKSKTLVFRSPVLPISFRLKKRVLFIWLALLLLTLTVLVMDVFWGEYRIPPLAVVQTLLGIDTDNADYSFAVYTLRLPRILVACLVGMALAVSGAIIQGVTRNPLAAPEIIGINAGASLAAVGLIVLFPNAPTVMLPFAAFGGALTVSLLIYLLAWQGGIHPIRLILIGVGIASIAGALTSFMVALGEINSVSQALVWLAGSVYGRSWPQVFSLLPWLAVFLPLTLLQAEQLDILNLGEEVAQGLGSKVAWQRIFFLLISSALAGAAVATAGTIGFVGLIAPHIARQLVGTLHGSLIPVAAMMGGMIVVIADFLGRIVFAPLELPCGIITALIGAPYFVYLLVKNP